jgi:hypothetical protein
MTVKTYNNGIYTVRYELTEESPSKLRWKHIKILPYELPANTPLEVVNTLKSEIKLHELKSHWQ